MKDQHDAPLFDPILPMAEIYNGKWRGLKERLGTTRDPIAMTVADSDFATAPCVLDALRERIDVGAFCYGMDRQGYREAVAWWLQTRHGWTIDPDWIVKTQGLGHAIATCLDIWSAPGEGIAYFTPVYHEFRLKTERAGRRPVELPMALVDNRYELDWDAAEAAITPDTKILLFCSPQNPSGRVWSAEELRAVAAFCEKHDLLFVSDEVHCDLLYDDLTHIPTDMAVPEARARTVTLFASSKTFNMAGLRVGQMIIPDDRLRAQAEGRLNALNYDAATLSVLANQAAFSPDGLAWRDAQMEYLTGNREVFDTLVNAIPGVRSMRLESTFLPWVDFSGTGMTPEEVRDRIWKEAGIGSSVGAQFGTGGESFHRFNIALPRSLIQKAGERMVEAFSDLQ